MSHATVPRPSSRGFTLIEVCVIVAAMAIVIAVVYPLFTRERDRRRWAHCDDTLGYGVAASLMQYVQDNDRTYPRAVNGPPASSGLPIISWRSVLVPYQTRSSWEAGEPWRCLSNPKNGDSGPDGLPVSYAVTDVGLIRPGEPMREDDVTTPASTILVFEDNGGFSNAHPADVPWDYDDGADKWTNILFAGHRSRSVYAFADGHVKTLLPMETIANHCNMWHLNNDDPVSPRALAKLKAAERNFGP